MPPSVVCSSSASRASKAALRAASEDKRRRANTAWKEEEESVQTRIGTWNTRGLGAPASELDHALKIECILGLIERRRWKAALLSDLKFEEEGVREYQTKEQTWIIIRGRVGIALNKEWAERWRRGGAEVTSIVKGKVNRSMAITIPREKNRKGIYLVCTYAPVFKGTNRKEREEYWEDLRAVLGNAKSSTIRIVVGGT